MTNPRDVSDHWAGNWPKLLVQFLASDQLDRAYRRNDLSGDKARLLDEVGFQLDQFHAGGTEMTRILYNMMRSRLFTGMRGIDFGSGMGGPARWFANAAVCKVDGYDLTPDFVNMARVLTLALGMRDECWFYKADITNLPKVERYDFGLMMSVSCNIGDREALYASIRRALRPDAPLGVLDIVLGENPGLVKPVPWSDDGKDNTSRLLSYEETIKESAKAGLTLDQVVDVSEKALYWFRTEARKIGIARRFGWEAVMPLWPEMVKSQIENLERDHIRFLCMTLTAT